jgi:predicted acylesterase/phospholipase RssA
MTQELDRGSPVVALGGVGMTAFAALPLIEALEQRGIVPRAVFASGFGCLLAALWAAGRSARDIETSVVLEFRRAPIRRNQLGAGLALLGVALGNLGYRGLWREHRFRALLDRWFGERRLEDLAFPLTICVTDVDSARLMRLTSGRLADAVYAGCAHFPLLPPAEMDGRMVCDGSYLQPVPLLAAAEEPGPILAIEAYFRSQDGPSRLENLHQHIFGLFHRHISGLHHESAQAMHPWPVQCWRICAGESGDAWDVATVAQAIAASRATLRDIPVEPASLPEHTA